MILLMRKLLVTIACLLLPIVSASANEDSHLFNLLNAVKDALYSGASLDNLYRKPQDIYYSPSYGLSLGVYEALLSITRNDDLECVPRLLCEAAAGGRPGYSGRDIKFDKASLTKFISYLNLGPANSSPLLTFARAALLGVSNRGDPYSCIINYSKCPRDQSRLLHYLNNHRGGFFQYFDRKDQSNRPSYQGGGYGLYNKGGLRQEYRPPKHKKNQIKFENSNFYGKLKKKATTGGGIYATKYSYSSFRFPESVRDYDRPYKSGYGKQMVFPDEKDRKSRQDPRIVNGLKEENFYYESGNRRPKKVNENFFPQRESSDTGRLEVPESETSDRLPPRFHFPSRNEGDEEEGNEFFGSKGNFFFPE